MNELDGAKVKLERAKIHLEEIDRQLTEYRRNKPYEVFEKLDEATGDQLVVVRGNPTAPPNLPAIGDALSNFRSSLDLLAWQLVKKAGQTPSPRTAFPIVDSPKEFNRALKSNMAGMTSKMTVAIKKYQPCFGPNDNRNLAMKSLREYRNIDVHRDLLVTHPGTAGMMWRSGGPEIPGGLKEFIHEGPVQDGTIIARFPPGDHRQGIGSLPSLVFAIRRQMGMRS